ncbi:MAG: glycosyltransferase family 4 protein [Reyranellaceae bacterium]
MSARCVVYHAGEPPWLAERTARVLRSMGHSPVVVTEAEIATALRGARSAWLLCAGAVPPPLPSIGPAPRRTPLLLCLPHAGGVAGYYVEQAHDLAALVRRTPRVADAIHALATSRRATSASGLACTGSPTPRVALIISALHSGGAERVTIELLTRLSRQGIDTRLAILDSPQRDCLPEPPDAFRLYTLPGPRADRLRAFCLSAVAWGADLIHAHLLDAASLALLRPCGIPVLTTLHNDRPGWPIGFPDAARSVSDLTVGCSVKVTRALAEARLIPTRTAWNGISVPLEMDVSARMSLRNKLGIADRSIVLLSVANERPQKRLEWLQHILTELLDGGVDAHAVIVGHIASDRALSPHPRLHRVGPRRDTPRWYSAADVYVSTSRYEGLSLSHLEALAAGLPIFTTEVGGAAELARDHDRYRVLPREATPTDFARAIRRLAVDRKRSSLGAFTTDRMVERHAAIYRRVLGQARVAKNGLVLIANDFATGGAQSSARRLLLALRDSGVRCSAIVLAEDDDNVTRGTAELRAQGIVVAAPDRATRRNTIALAAWVVALVERVAAQSVVFWNAITEVKVRIADQLPFLRLFDVSPGEMYFRSLDNYFTHPARDLPYLTPQDYGALLQAVVVKYQAEAPLAAERLGAPVRVISNGVPVMRRNTVSRSLRRPLRVGTLVRLSPDKKVELLIDALQRAAPRMPAFEFLVGGQPDPGAEDYARSLQLRAAGLPMRWMGYVPSARFMSAIDLLVLVAEPAGCPNTSLEAMAAGVPVLATTVGGMIEQIVHGESGWLAPRNDVGALAALLESAAADRHRLREVGRMAQDRMRRAFGIEKMRDSYIELFGLAGRGV